MFFPRRIFIFDTGNNSCALGFCFGFLIKLAKTFTVILRYLSVTVANLSIGLFYKEPSFSVSITNNPL